MEDICKRCKLRIARSKVISIARAKLLEIVQAKNKLRLQKGNNGNK